MCQQSAPPPCCNLRLRLTKGVDLDVVQPQRALLRGASVNDDVAPNGAVAGQRFLLPRRQCQPRLRQPGRADAWGEESTL